MTALLRQRLDPSWLGVAGAFALGAAATCVVAWVIERVRREPGPVADDVVLSRVRARIGELVSQPAAIAVSVENGVVRLAGSVPSLERDALLTELLNLPGVVRLRSALASADA